MTVKTHIEQALARVRDEQVAIAEKQTAYKQFISEIEQLAVESPSKPRGALQTTTGSVVTMHATGASGSDGCKRVREIFADTVRPHSTADVEDSETLLETIAAELSDQIAMALTPQNAAASFTATLKSSVLSEATQRQHELQAMERALDREAESVIKAKDALDNILQWIVETNETPLTTLDFEMLQSRHDRLTEFSNQCESIVTKRQSLLQATTSADGTVGLSHQELLTCLYVAFPVDYPVLSTAIRLKQVCKQCQQVIRDHLVRRV